MADDIDLNKQLTGRHDSRHATWVYHLTFYGVLEYLIICEYAKRPPDNIEKLF